jgi:hypothetical protein
LATDLQGMLEFLALNGRDHLQAAVNNTPGVDPRVLERSAFSDVATRIVLLELQMLLLVTLDLNQLVWSPQIAGVDGNAPIGLILRACHLSQGTKWFQTEIPGAATSGA